MHGAPRKPAAKPYRTMTSREFNQHVSRAKRAAKEGPLVITERGKPAYVLMDHKTFAAEAAHGSTPKTLFDALNDDGALDFDFDPPRLNAAFRPVDFE